MKIAAIDLGDARTGIAVSDESATLAGETTVISEWNTERRFERVAEFLSLRKITKVVVGNPINMDGSRGERSAKAEDFASRLAEATGADVILWDERRTTVEAHSILTQTGVHGKKRRGVVDAVAASLILEGYLLKLKGEITR